MRLAFMGSDAIALPLLRYLHADRPAGIELQAVYTQPDRRTGRGMQLKANAIKQWAEAHGIAVRQPVKCGPDETEFLSGEGIRAVLVMAYGQLLPRSLLESVPLGFLNLHASILPRFRGASPIHTAVALGLGQTGVSLMRIIPKMDAGPVADVETVEIGPDDTSASVYERMGEACVPLLSRTLPRMVDGTLSFVPQDERQVTYCRIIEKTDSHLDFRAPARELFNRIRAFQPWPGTAFPFNGMDIRILQAGLGQLTGQAPAPGTFYLAEDGTPAIACGREALLPLVLQRPGGRPLAVGEFLRGLNIPYGTILESREMRPLEDSLPFPYRKK